MWQAQCHLELSHVGFYVTRSQVISLARPTFRPMEWKPCTCNQMNFPLLVPHFLLSMRKITHVVYKAGHLTKNHLDSVLLEYTSLAHASLLVRFTGEPRSNQAQIVDRFIDEKDVLVSLPTGRGKSLCYCVLPRVHDILCGSNSSKNQLHSDHRESCYFSHGRQVQHMTERNINAVYVGDCKSKANVCDGLYQLVFLSLEALSPPTGSRESRTHGVRTGWDFQRTRLQSRRSTPCDDGFAVFRRVE